MTPSFRGWKLVASALGLVALTAVPSRAVTLPVHVYLIARSLTKTMPDSNIVPMWGFALDADDNLATAGSETPTVPGPMITLTPSTTTLIIHLRNDLPSQPVSIVIPGLDAALSPVSLPDPQSRQRVHSFTAEAAPNGGTQDYTFTARPGTFLYQSGSHPSVQVPMGLYGAVRQNTSAGLAYTGVPFNNEAVLLYSEVDPVQNAAVATNSNPSAIHFAPTYFLINGNPYPTATPVLDHPFVGGEAALLLRFLNAGLKSHAPALEGRRMVVVAEDGNKYPYPRDEYEILLPAGKTIDALLPLSSQQVPIYDRTLALTNAGTGGGGMLVYMPPPPSTTTTSTSTSTSLSTSTSRSTTTSRTTSSSTSTSRTTTSSRTTSSSTSTSSTTLPGTSAAYQEGVSGPANSANVDTYMRLSGLTTNFGTDPELVVGVTNAANKVCRTVVDFNLAGVPSGATITSCTLRVNITQRTSPTASHIRRVCGEHWDDNLSESQSTWNAWKTGSSWGAAGAASTAACASGGDYTTVGEVAYTPPAGTGLFTFPSLTALCQDAVTNRGGRLRLRISQDAEGTQSNLIKFDSSDAGTAANRPRLAVTWTP